MAGTVLGIGETNPKRGAIQSDARRIDGLRLYENAAATKETYPVGTIVTLQEETTSKKQIVVVGNKPYDGDEYSTYAILRIGFLEASTQQSGSVNQSAGEISVGDFVTMVSGVDFIPAVPYKAADKPVTGQIIYVTPDGEAAATAGGGANAVMYSRASYGVAGNQSTNQLKSGFVFLHSLPLTAV